MLLGGYQGVSMKHYGIFLAYGPLVDLRFEGLGRHLAAFLRAAQDSKEFHLTIACPQWMAKNLQELCIYENIDLKSFTLVMPTGVPVFLNLLGALRWGGRVFLRRTYGAVSSFMASRVNALLPASACSSADIYMPRSVNWLAHIRHWWVFAFLSLAILPFAAMGVAIAVVLGLVGSPIFLLMWFAQRARHLARTTLSGEGISFIRKTLGIANLRGAVSGYYRNLLAAEIAMVAERANCAQHVSAWYCPAAFWPEFNRISKPRLICVPDIVTGEFPAGFALVTGEQFYESVRAIETTVKGGAHFITYSESVKWKTLVERYRVRPEAVRVVRHAPNRLDSWIRIAGLPYPVAASRTYCEAALLNALHKSHNAAYVAGFRNGAVKFIFYASQFRPNKNVLNLLRAYEYLLRRRYLPHKLILTGNAQDMQDIHAFIQQHQLQNDVLCLHGLSTKELATCYHLADLAVNPSLSEGGCPFTFTEALSVDTPVVMARIPVTMEVLDDPALESCGTFFDPYEWKEMAACIEAGLRDRETLLAAQKPVYNRLAERNWRDVVDEYVAALDAIAGTAAIPDIPAVGGKAA